MPPEMAVTPHGLLQIPRCPSPTCAYTVSFCLRSRLPSFIPPWCVDEFQPVLCRPQQGSKGLTTPCSFIVPRTLNLTVPLYTKKHFLSLRRGAGLRTSEPLYLEISISIHIISTIDVF